MDIKFNQWNLNFRFHCFGQQLGIWSSKSLCPLAPFQDNSKICGTAYFILWWRTRTSQPQTLDLWEERCLICIDPWPFALEPTGLLGHFGGIVCASVCEIYCLSQWSDCLGLRLCVLFFRGARSLINQPSQHLYIHMYFT